MITTTSALLYELRNRKGWSQEEVAAAVGIDRVTYTRYENGTRTPNALALLKLAHLFKVTPESLLLMDDPEGYTAEEEQLLFDFRSLNRQGQEYILQTIDMVKDKYKKRADLPKVEAQG